MGITYVKGTVSGKGRKKRELKFLVDSGASYTLLPDDVWRDLGLKPKRRMSFTLADGTEIERDVSECHIKLPQGDGHTPVILGEKGDDALLGAVTLENLGLVLNPFQRTLQPMMLRLT
jgi:clan AA aspartic protease